MNLFTCVPYIYKKFFGKNQGKKSAHHAVSENIASPFLSAVLPQFYPSPHIQNISLQVPIDIIIPVFNGFEYLDPLFSSLFLNTNIAFRLIVIEDCSTDERVRPYLEGLRTKHENMVLILNQTNAGFVKNANRAVALTHNHFVILNSDVEVPPQWLTRLMYPIIKMPGIASTTPFTNAATICSFPTFLNDCPIFENMGLTQIDGFFQQVNPLRNIYELPTGIGFCMGINKDVVNKIGMFDEKTFGRGYGEENDWCRRAVKQGWKNVLVPNLYVYHKHGGSFPDKKRQHMRDENVQRVQQKHPEYLAAVHEFINKDPYKHIRDFLIILITSHCEPLPTLIIDHDLGGGANYYREQLVRQKMCCGEKVFLLTFDPQHNIFHLIYSYTDKLGQSVRIEHLMNSFHELLDLLTFLKIKEIVVNNLVSFPARMEILDALKKIKTSTGCALTIPVHDYLLICPSYMLLNDNLQYCHIPEESECTRCLPLNQSNPYVGNERDVHQWRSQWLEFLLMADSIICFSHHSKQLIQRAYPGINDEAISIIPHTVTAIKNKFVAPPAHEGINIGVIGAIGVHKGSTVIASMAEIIEGRRLKNITINIIGTLSPPVTNPHVRITGPYRSADLPTLIHEHAIDIMLIPSIWPETFSYTTEEAMHTGLPVAVFDTGAPAERVKKYERGIIIEKIDPECALSTLLSWLEKHKHGTAVAPMARRSLQLLATAQQWDHKPVFIAIMCRWDGFHLERGGHAACTELRKALARLPSVRSLFIIIDTTYPGSDHDTAENDIHIISATVGLNTFAAWQKGVNFLNTLKTSYHLVLFCDQKGWREANTHLKNATARSALTRPLKNNAVIGRQVAVADGIRIGDDTIHCWINTNHPFLVTKDAIDRTGPLDRINSNNAYDLLPAAYPPHHLILSRQITPGDIKKGHFVLKAKIPYSGLVDLRILCEKTFVPKKHNLNLDVRKLGISILKIQVSDKDLSDAEYKNGWYAQDSWIAQTAQAAFRVARPGTLRIKCYIPPHVFHKIYNGSTTIKIFNDALLFNQNTPISLPLQRAILLRFLSSRTAAFEISQHNWESFKSEGESFFNETLFAARLDANGYLLREWTP